MDDFSTIYPGLQIHPHPIKIPYPVFNPPSEDDDEKWREKAGYRSELGFMLWFDFDLEKERAQARTLAQDLKSHPTRNHPCWFNLLPGPSSPNEDSDSEWLRKAGYEDMEGFMRFYDLDIKRVATRLLDRFRSRHQSVWEGEQQKLKENLLSDVQVQERAFIDCSPLAVRFGQRRFRMNGRRMTKMEIEQAVLWHERQRHLGYRDLKMLAMKGTLHGLPEFLANMIIEDIPVCEHCTKVLGMLDR